MKLSDEPDHLPKWPMNPAAYKRLYTFNQNIDDQMPASADWKGIRIKPSQSEDDVYRLLPSAVDFEYSGYLTKSRVRYCKGETSSAGSLMTQPCTFHSHPTKNPHLANIPSLKDIYSFLHYRHLRTITVGSSKIWVWDKTKATLATVRRLADWTEANHLRAVTRLMKKDFAHWPQLCR